MDIKNIDKAKLPQHIIANNPMTGIISQNNIVSLNINLGKALIVWVNGFKITAIFNPPDKFSAGKIAVLKKR